MSPKKETKKSGKSAAAKGKSSGVFTAEEKAAMRAAAAERKRAGKSDGESDVQAAIAVMKGSDRTMAKRIHEIVKASAPSLAPKTWYGMPAYANADGKAVCPAASGLGFHIGPQGSIEPCPPLSFACQTVRDHHRDVFRAIDESQFLRGFQHFVKGPGS